MSALSSSVSPVALNRLQAKAAVDTCKAAGTAKLACASAKSNKVTFPTSHSRNLKVVCKAQTLEEQTREMNQAEKRWQQNVSSGRVKSVSASDAVKMMEGGEWIMLDVRPPEEVEKGEVVGSTCVPIFVVDDDMSVSGLLKQMSAFGMGGWWLGGQHMKANEQFIPQVLASIPKGKKVVVACQKGLRSLAACEQLSRAGFQSLAWLNGGFEAQEKEAFTTVDGQDVRLAGVGGLSGAVGWNPVQQKEGISTMDGPFGNVIKIAGGVIALDALAFAYELVSSGGN